MASPIERQLEQLTSDIAELSQRLDTLRGEAERFRDLPARLAVIQYRLDQLDRKEANWTDRGWIVLNLALCGVTCIVLAIASLSFIFYLYGEG